MKKIQIKGKLSLNKQTIASLNDEEMNGVKGGWWSSGCSDGCSGWHTAFRCTKSKCTADCSRSDV